MCLFQLRFLTKNIPRILIDLTVDIIALFSLSFGMGDFMIFFFLTMNLNLLDESSKPFILL